MTEVVICNVKARNALDPGTYFESSYHNKFIPIHSAETQSSVVINCYCTRMCSYQLQLNDFLST